VEGEQAVQAITDLVTGSGALSQSAARLMTQRGCRSSAWVLAARPRALVWREDRPVSSETNHRAAPARDRDTEQSVREAALMLREGAAFRPRPKAGVCTLRF
jgi:hypothetical protein